MRFILLCFIAFLKFGTLKTEPIDFDRKNGQLFPSRLVKSKDLELLSMESEWNDNDMRYQPYDSNIRKIVGVENNADYENEVLEIPEDPLRILDSLNDAQSAQLSNYLIKLLERPGEWKAPLVLIKEPQDTVDERVFPAGLDSFRTVSKRTRFYRPYPWLKRQNSRYRSADYDNYNPCMPSKNDVSELLRAIDDARKGNRARVINFCNRRRPAAAVFTNIRFLGRRKK